MNRAQFLYESIEDFRREVEARDRIAQRTGFSPGLSSQDTHKEFLLHQKIIHVIRRQITPDEAEFLQRNPHLLSLENILPMVYGHRHLNDIDDEERDIPHERMEIPRVVEHFLFQLRRVYMPSHRSGRRR